MSMTRLTDEQWLEQQALYMASREMTAEDWLGLALKAEASERHCMATELLEYAVNAEIELRNYRSAPIEAVAATWKR